MKHVVLAGAVRTAIGRFGGSLAGTSATDLAVAVVAETLRRTGIDEAGARPRNQKERTFATGSSSVFDFPKGRSEGWIGIT